MTIASTLTPQQAAGETWQALVIGAGPAGSIAARQLAAGGLRTLLVERKAFPRAKVCGGCVNGRALAALELLGLGDVTTQLGAVPLRRFHVRCGRSRAEISLPAGVAVSRAAFDSELARAAIAAGAEFLPQTTAQLLDDDPPPGRQPPDHRRTQLYQQGQASSVVSAQVVLLADGLGNPSLPREDTLRSRAAPLSRIGVGGSLADCPPGYEPGTIFMAVGGAGYVGLVRVEDGALNIAAALDPAAVSRQTRPAAAITGLVESCRLPPLSGIESADWSGTVPLTRFSTRPARRRVLLLGDAAGYVEPFTGEGIACAVTSAAAAARLVIDHMADWNEQAERQWIRLHRQLFDRRQLWCRLLARLLRHPSATRGLLRTLAVAPWLARPVVGRLNQPPRC